MTFSTLPLADQLKALQAGDELHLRGGGWLPFEGYDQGYICVNLGGGRHANMDNHIIRVVRPSEAKDEDGYPILGVFNAEKPTPEIVGRLRNNWCSLPPKDPYEKLADVCNMLADHFEQEARK